MKCLNMPPTLPRPDVDRRAKLLICLAREGSLSDVYSHPSSKAVNLSLHHRMSVSRLDNTLLLK